MGYDFFVSLDLDEYLVPLSSDLTAVDELEKFFTSTQRNILPLKKFNYQSTPHLLEPVNLLTIEAYHVCVCCFKIEVYISLISLPK